MAESNSNNLDIRLLRSDDFDALVQLDSKLRGGEMRREYWEKKFAIFRLRHPNLSVVASHDERVVGYAMGNISGWEFGVKAGIGWIELIGIDPEYRRRGVARDLVEELLRQFQALQVKTVYTMITANHTEMLEFFRSMEFKEGGMIQFEKTLS